MKKFGSCVTTCTLRFISRDEGAGDEGERTAIMKWEVAMLT